MANTTRSPPSGSALAPSAAPAIMAGGFHRKGGVGAFREMVYALEDNYNVALTADVPKRAREAGLGVIMLARESGRPIMPFAMATSSLVRLKNWDRTTINLPFGRGALGGGEIIMVPG